MPIQIKCQCGKSLSIPDAMVGKAVKCPGCSKVLKVPAKAAPAKAASAAAPAVASGGLDDLFDEEGFSKQVAAVCPSCAAELTANAVLCTKCGYHREHGTRLQAHLTAGVDIDHGTLALMKAESDMAKADEMQAKLVRGAGMPWWGLALVLFMLGSGIVIGVLAVNQAKRIDEGGNFDFMELFFQLCGAAFLVVGVGALISMAYTIYKQRNGRGIWKPILVSIVCIGIAVGCFVMAGR
jgi:ribosomal protein L40E